MNILRWLNPLNWFRRDSSSPVTTGDASVDNTRGSYGRTYWELLTGGAANAELSIATVYRCVNLLSDSVAVLPCHFKRYRDGMFVTDINSHLHYLLNVQPDPNYSAYDFWRLVVQRILLDGEAFVIPMYDLSSMEISRLALCGSNTVTHDEYTDTYTVTDTVNGIYGEYDEREVLHFKGMSLDGKRGVSVLTYARLTSRIAGTGDKETLTRFANGGNVRGIVSNDTSVRGFGEYQDEQLAKTAVDIDEKLNNLGQRIVSVPGQVQFNQMSLSSVDMQFLESRKFTVREICRFFGVHPSFVFDDTSNNYKSAEMANVAYLNNTLNPILRKIESELLRKLVAPSLATRRKFEFDRKALYSCDLETLSKYWAGLIAAGLSTVNELRLEQNKPALPGGDKLLVSANLKGIDELGVAPVATTQETKQKEDEDED